jgi:outer membrane protein assembly factor BamB
MSDTYRIRGTVVEEDTGRPLPGLKVRAYDKDKLYSDLLGTATTDESGSFELTYTGEEFRELFEKQPDIYLEVYDASGERLLYTSEESVRWGAGADEQFEVKIPRGLTPGRQAGGAKPPAEASDPPPVVFELPADPADRRPFLVGIAAGQEKEGAAVAGLEVAHAENPLPRATLGDLGVAATVGGGGEKLRSFGQSVLVIPLDARALTGIDETTIRVFRHDEETGNLRPVWNSGVNTSMGFAWAKVTRPGTYVPIGLPRDRLLQELLREASRERRLSDADSPEESEKLTRGVLGRFFEESPEVIEAVRAELARAEVQTAAGGVPLKDLRLGHGGHILPLPLPRGADFREFAERVRGLEFTRGGGLPEEELFYPPDAPRPHEAPWPVLQDRRISDIIDTTPLFKHHELRADILVLIRYLFSKNWWMYQHDERHTGTASGWSDIRSTNAGTLIEQSRVAVEGNVVTKPSVVNGYVYVGTCKSGGSQKTVLYKIELATGSIVGKFEVTGSAFYPIYGIGGSPAVTGGKVYFSTVYGQIYCLDASTMSTTTPPPAPLWVTDLKTADMGKNQPVNNPHGDSWSGPLVVNGKVYVGSGEGESSTTYGFVWCLNAATGVVEWVYCTSKLDAGAENSPNSIPASMAAAWAAGAGFDVVDDDRPGDIQTGNAVWSSCAYDSVTRRIFVGTGNSEYGVDPGPGDGTAQPDYSYGSGLLALDAATGAFAGFHQPEVDDSYWPLDSDIDVPGAPTVFWQDGRRVVGYGSKNGSYFLLDATDMSVIARRQLLARSGGSGLPGDRGAGINAVVPTGGSGENRWGVMATAALHPGLDTLFVGLGGYVGVAGFAQTPFMRAVDSTTLEDRWATAVSGGVAKYTMPVPPMYSSDEAGLSSPAVVNDVVFVSTHKCALYALDAATGLCLWSAPGQPSGGWPVYALGPAIYGNYVVHGADQTVFIYKLPPAIVRIPWDKYIYVERFPWPPEPDPRLGELINQLRGLVRR